MRPIDVVRRVAPRARAEYISAFEHGDALLNRHGITTPLRLAHFLAQVCHESGGLTLQWESGKYSARRLVEVFGAGRHSAGVTAAEAQRLANDPERIFERVYGLGNPKKARELGNTRPGDGYRYRGGGILQTTGRANYRRMGERCGVDFEARPELVASAEHALKPAVAEWSEGNLNAAADRDDIRAITRRINGGLNGLTHREHWLAKIKAAIGASPIALTDAKEQRMTQDDNGAGPAWLATMREMEGTREFPGGPDNPVIIGWRDEIAAAFPEMRPYAREYTHDSIAWCGLTVARAMAVNGIRPPDGFLWARNWAQWGRETEPRLGCVMVFTRGSGGHVALYEGETKTQYIVRGGNQSDAVNKMRIDKSRFLAARWPDASELAEAPRPPVGAVTVPTPIALPERPGAWSLLWRAVRGKDPAPPPPAEQPARPGLTAIGDPAIYDVQTQLAAKGYAMVGRADGEMGPNTRAAILAFRRENGLSLSDAIDDALRAALVTAPVRQVSQQRASATASDLRREGSEQVRVMDGFGWLGKLVAGAGVLGGVQQSGALDQVQSTLQGVQGAAESIAGVLTALLSAVSWIMSHWWLLAIVAGGYILFRAVTGVLNLVVLFRQGVLMR